MRVSIIIPIYNQEKYLDDCLESVLEQDIDDFQVVLIDDGSTDKSGGICEKYLKRSSVFEYIYQENTGLGGARNTGLKHAKGKYVLFLDSDDVLEKNCLGTLCSYMDQYELDILYVDEYVCDEHLNIDYINPTYPFMQTQIKKMEALEYCMQPAHIWARVYKRELFDTIHFMNIWYEDMAVFPELISKAEKIAYYKSPVVYYRQHKEAITHQETDIRNLDVIKAWDRVLHLSGLSMEEKEAVVKAIRKSIVTFAFFRVNYALDYFEWHEKVLLKERGKKNVSKLFSKEIFQDDYPFIQQANMLNNKELIKQIKVLDKLYDEGGSYYFVEECKTEDTVCDEHLSLVFENHLKLYDITICAQSPVLLYVKNNLRKQNLISAKGQVKSYALEKILVSGFLEFGYSVRIIKQ